MKIQLLEGPYFFESAIKGLRKSFGSQDKSDSSYYDNYGSDYCLGEQDLKLLQKVVRAGNDHAKCMRLVELTVDITARRGWWQHFLTYKIGVERGDGSSEAFDLDQLYSIDTLSDSVMHNIMKRKLTQDDFERPIRKVNLFALNQYIKYKDFEALINELPEGFLQSRIIKVNYQMLRALYKSRRTHKLHEWKQFCEWIEGLPYANELIVI